MLTDAPIAATRKRILTLPIAQHGQIQALNQQSPILWNNALFKVVFYPSRPKMNDWKSQKWMAVKAVLIETGFINENAASGDAFLSFGGVDRDNPRIELEITEVR